MIVRAQSIDIMILFLENMIHILYAIDVSWDQFDKGSLINAKTFQVILTEISYNWISLVVLLGGL